MGCQEVQFCCQVKTNFFINKGKLSCDPVFRKLKNSYKTFFSMFPREIEKCLTRHFWHISGHFPLISPQTVLIASNNNFVAVIPAHGTPGGGNGIGALELNRATVFSRSFIRAVQQTFSFRGSSHLFIKSLDVLNRLCCQQRSSGHGADFRAVWDLLVAGFPLVRGSGAQQGESLLCGDHWGFMELRTKWEKPA